MRDSIKEIIGEVLARLEELGIDNTPEARDLIFETGMAETGYRHLEQMKAKKGIGAVSFWQIEPGTIKDIWDNYIVYRKPLIEMAYSLGFKENEQTWCVMTNIALAVFFCRIYYRRKPGSIPLTIEGRSTYWKKWYNTELGAGTESHYLKANI